MIISSTTTVEDLIDKIIKYFINKNNHINKVQQFSDYTDNMDIILLIIIQNKNLIINVAQKSLNINNINSIYFEKNLLLKDKNLTKNQSKKSNYHY